MIPGALRLRGLAEFAAERFAAVNLARTDRFKVMVLGLEPGHFIPVHRPGVDLVCYVLDGQGVAEVGGVEHRLEPGVMVLAPRGTARGIRAATRLVALAFVSPLPGPDDHREVELGLRQGRFHPQGAADGG